jgi:putative transposase
MRLYRDSSYKHGVGWSIWHLEWVTKYRRRVFEDLELQKLCGIAFEEAAKRYNFILDEYEVQPDHVHLLVHLRPSMSPAEAVCLIKGYTSTLMFRIAEDKLKPYSWAVKGHRSLWGDGKFASSVGHITLEKAKRYVSTHKAHHAQSESPPFRVGEDSIRAGGELAIGADPAH